MNKTPSYDPQNERPLWDEAAADFDTEADHGLRDERVREAWYDLLHILMPVSPARVLDIGCGTGSLTLLLSEMGHTVIGSDFSAQMLAQAQRKLSSAGYRINWIQMDAAFPSLAAGQFDVVLCRHLLWALPQPEKVVKRWRNLLKSDGRLVLIEGYWHTDAGLHASDVLAMLPDGMQATTYPLSDQPDLWGGPVSDERYAIVASGSI